MSIFSAYPAALVLVMALLIMPGKSVHAHFPWLMTGDEGRATLFFGESIAEKNYKLPDSVASANLKALNARGEVVSLDTQRIESDSLIGLQADEALPDASLVFTEITYGNYHGALLKYTVFHQPGALPEDFDKARIKQVGSKLFAAVVQAEAGVDVYVTWEGQPLADAEVHLYCEEGHEEGLAKTDANGKVSFSSGQVEAGLNGIMLGHTLDVDGQDHSSESNYLTLTFISPAQSSEAMDKTTARKFDTLPYEITSFGAARVGDVAYVYGGHTGDAHSYSTKEQSNQLLSLDLMAEDGKWQTLTEGKRLQGLAMIPHRSKVVLIGGFSAKNAYGEEHDLESQIDVRAFDTKTQTWTELPSLPSGRSSHDATILGDTIYVVGGWNMQGGNEPSWHQTALSLDLSVPNAKWQELPQPPFERRALATVAHRGKVYVIGGMDRSGGPTREVVVFDPQTQAWTMGPELHGESRMAGFGAAGCSLGESLIVSTYEGDILRLTDDGEAWELLGKSKEERFFHRLLPLTASQVVAIGGANMEEGKYTNLAVFSLTK